MLRRVKIALIEADDRLAARVFRDSDHAVDQKRIRDRIDVCADHDELIDIRHSRADERIAPLLHRVDAPLAVRIEAQLHPVTDQRAAPVVPEAAARLALHDLIAGGHIVKAAEGLFDPSSHAASGGIPSVPETEGSGPSLTVSTISAPVVTTVSCAMLCSTTVPASASL